HLTRLLGMPGSARLAANRGGGSGDFAGADPAKVFQRFRIGHRNARRTDACGRRQQPAETRLRDLGKEFAAQPAHPRGFMRHQYARSLADGCEHGVAVPRPQRSQVDDFGIDALAGQHIGRRHAGVGGAGPAKQGDVRARAPHRGLADSWFGPFDGPGYPPSSSRSRRWLSCSLIRTQSGWSNMAGVLHCLARHKLRARKDLSPHSSEGISSVSVDPGTAAAGPGVGESEAGGSDSTPAGIAPESGVLIDDLRARSLGCAEELERNGGAAVNAGAEAGEAATAASSVEVGGDAGAATGAGRTGARRGASGPYCFLCSEPPKTSNMNAASASNTIAARPPTSHAVSLGFPAGTTTAAWRDSAGGVAEARNSG